MEANGAAICVALFPGKREEGLGTRIGSNPSIHQKNTGTLENATGLLAHPPTAYIDSSNNYSSCNDTVYLAFIIFCNKCKWWVSDVHGVSQAGGGGVCRVTVEKGMSELLESIVHTASADVLSS